MLLLTGTAEVWMLAVLAFVYGTAAALFMPALIGLIPQTVRPARLQEANALLALTRSIASVAGPAVAGVLVVAAGSGEAIAVDAATFAFSALCLARMRISEEAPAARATSRSSPGCAAGWNEVRSRAWLRWGLIAMSIYHVFVLPAVFVLGPALAERELDGASSWAAIVACFGIGGVLGNVVAMRIPLRRPVFIAALALVGASTQAAIIGSGLGTVGIAALELLAGVCVALFFTLWDLSIQEQIPRHARLARQRLRLQRLHGPHAAGHGGLRADRRCRRPAGDAARHERDRPAGALAWLAQPSVRRLRRPQPDAPADRPRRVPRAASSLPAVGAGGR